MHVTPENDCEKSHDENDPNTDKLTTEGNGDAQKDLFPSVNGVKSAVSIEIDEKLVPLTEPAKETDVVPAEADENVEEPLANGVDHDASDDIEEEDVVEDEEMASVDEMKPPVVEAPIVAAAVAAEDKKPAADLDECTRMETDELDAEPAATAQSDTMLDVEDKIPASSPSSQPASNKPAATESAECAEFATESSSVAVSADKSDLPPAIPTKASIASPSHSNTSPAPAEIDPEDEKICEENDDKAEGLVQPAEESTKSSPAEKVESPEEPVRSPEETVKLPQEKVNSIEEKVSSPVEKQIVESSPKANSIAEEKLICKEEVTTPIPEDFVTNSNPMSVEDISSDSKIADKIVTLVTKSETIDKKPQVVILNFINFEEVMGPCVANVILMIDN